WSSARRCICEATARGPRASLPAPSCRPFPRSRQRRPADVTSQCSQPAPGCLRCIAEACNCTPLPCTCNDPRNKSGQRGLTMKNRLLQRVFKTGVLLSAALLALTIRATLANHDGDQDHDGHHQAAARLATGQYITPTALDDAVQQYLNPGLAGYPNFIAGEAVRSQLSPDGSTLAVITAGQNSLDNAAGTTDTANSTQYIFLYDVTGAHKAQPALTQVIQQFNAYVGLVFSPNGNTLYAAGGADDRVYVYGKSGGTWAMTAQILLNHANKGVGVNVMPNAAGLGISADGGTLVVANNYNDSISVIDTATRTVRYEHDLRPY